MLSKSGDGRMLGKKKRPAENRLLGERFAGRLSDMGLEINLEDNRTRVSSNSKQRARAKEDPKCMI